jgi:hypothetical protein
MEMENNMPKGKTPYTYKSDDTPVSLAQQWNVPPSAVIQANPGGYPFETGQTIYQPAAPTTFQQQFKNFFGNAPSYLNARGTYGQVPGQTTLPTTPSYLRPRGLGGQLPSATPYNNPIYGANGQPIIVPRGAYGQPLSVAPAQPTVTPFSNVNPNVPTGNAYSYMSGIKAPVYGASTGRPDPGLVQRILNHPEEYDALTPDQQKAIDNIATGVSAVGGNPAVDEAQSPGGRFIQVGEKRWERNKNGRLVRVQYTGGGSWRNKRVISGGKNQAKPKPQQAKENANGGLAGIGVVTFNVGSG